MTFFNVRKRKKLIIFSHTVHYCSSSIPNPSEMQWFLQSPSFWNVQSVLIGQQSQT